MKTNKSVLNEYKEIDRFNKVDIETPIQEVIPLSKIEKNIVEEAEGQLTVHVPKSLIKKLKQTALDEGKKQKELVKLALSKYLKP